MGRLSDKVKGNIKTKIISILAALALWLYVLAVVDPDERKVIENIPITVNRINQIEKEGFVVYPKLDISTDITLYGKLSELQKLNKNNIDIYGEIDNPVEGSNIVSLKTNISNRVSRELKDSSVAVNLEKITKKEVDIVVKLKGPLKDDAINIKTDYKKISLKGARSLIERLEYVGVELDTSNLDRESKFEKKLVAKAYDKEGKSLDLDMTRTKIRVSGEFRISKILPLRIDYRGSMFDINSYALSPENVSVVASRETLKNIDYIKTKKLTDSDIENLLNKNIELILPQGVKLKNENTKILLTKK